MAEASEEGVSEAEAKRRSIEFKSRGGLREILEKAPEERAESEIEEVFATIDKLQDAFLTNLEESVKRAVCRHLTLEEFCEDEEIFDYGAVGDKLYIVLSGRVQLEVPDENMSHEGEIHFVKAAKMETGKVFGEIALISEDCKRKGRCTALKATKLLSLHRDDYRRCVGASQEMTIKERVAFLRMAEEGLLAEMRDVELQAMSGSMTEEHYIGEHEIISQGREVDRIIFVKSGFCKVVRELHPKYTKVFCRYANYGEPMPNPYADGGEFLRVGEKGVWPTRRQPPVEVKFERAKKLKLESHQMLKNMLRKLGEEEGLERRIRTETAGSVEEEKPRSLRVVVSVISKGTSVGVMELMEGLTHQCTVLSSPLAEIYSISRFDFIRNCPRSVTHRLFCNYKARLSDQHLIQRLVQKHRWDLYKRGLLEEIRSWSSAASRGIVDREDPVPMIGGSALEEETLIRVGRGEKLWDQRARTPPKVADPDQGVKQIFHVQCSREAGKPVVVVDREQRDASMDEFERKLLETTANARYRGKLRRAKEQMAAAVADVAAAEALEEEAKRSLEEQKMREKQRIEALRQEMRDKVKRDWAERRPRKTLRGSLPMVAQNSGRGSKRASKVANLPTPGPASARGGSKERHTLI